MTDQLEKQVADVQNAAEAWSPQRTLGWAFDTFGSVAIVALVSAVISTQIKDRTQFADSELHAYVMERWGAPISQPAADPGNAGFVYQRFQRGVMHYRAGTGTDRPPS